MSYSQFIMAVFAIYVVYYAANILYDAFLKQSKVNTGEEEEIISIGEEEEIPHNVVDEDFETGSYEKEEEKNESEQNYVSVNESVEMNKNQNWVCPIQTVSSDSAFYSISNDSITLPLKSQFKDGESFYGTELHEMGHSTGVKNRLNRKGFYENDKFNYGREELVAELISALSGVYLGISVTVREENAAYLKSWCKAIKEEPKFLFTVLADAIKGSKFIAQHLNIRLDVEEVEEEKNTKVA
jgi:antirestriction protein ArdC